MPFKYFVSLLKKSPIRIATHDEIPNAIQLTKKTVSRIFNLSNIESSCLSKSALFKLLLNYQGVKSKLSLGIAKKYPLKIVAHAYLKIDERVIYLENEKYFEIYSF